MSIAEQIDHFTYWLASAEAQSRKAGNADRHAEWALGVWDKHALALVVPSE